MTKTNLAQFIIGACALCTRSATNSGHIYVGLYAWGILECIDLDIFYNFNES